MTRDELLKWLQDDQAAGNPDRPVILYDELAEHEVGSAVAILGHANGHGPEVHLTVGEEIGNEFGRYHT